MVGTASVRDSCGQVGRAYTNAMIPVRAGGLSTISLNLPIGASFFNRTGLRNNITSYTKQIRLEDLACPTWGLIDAEPKSGGYVTVGSPFFPIIHPPSEISAFDPIWSGCTDFDWREDAINNINRLHPPKYPGGPHPLGPQVLVPALALAPATTPVNVVTSSDPNPTVEISPKANPANSRSPELPLITIKPSILDPLQHSTKDVGHKSREDLKPASMSTANSEDFDIKDSKHQSAQNKPGKANHATVDPGSILNSLGSHSQQAAPGIGALIFSAFGASWVPNPSVKSSSGNTVGSLRLDSLRSGLEENPSVVPLDGSTISPNIPSRYAAGTSIVMGNLVGDPTRSNELSRLSASGNGHFTLAGQDFMTHHSAVLVDGTTIKPSGIGITKPGRLISLDSDGNLVVDTSTIQVANFARKTIDDQIFNKNPSLLAVDSRTITPGGSGITVSGTPVRLNSNGNLIIDKSTVEHANIFPTPLSSKYPTNNQLFTGNPSALSMKGKILTAGETGITISGTPIRLDPDGNLIVNMSTIEIVKISPTPPPSIYTVYSQLFTGNPSFLSIKGKTILPVEPALPSPAH